MTTGDLQESFVAQLTLNTLLVYAQVCRSARSTVDARKRQAADAAQVAVPSADRMRQCLLALPARRHPSGGCLGLARVWFCVGKLSFWASFGVFHFDVVAAKP